LFSHPIFPEIIQIGPDSLKKFWGLLVSVFFRDLMPFLSNWTENIRLIIQEMT